MQLVDVIGVDLGEPIKRGSQLFWQCPFHDDHDPSLTIMPDGRRWKCFGCEKSGDAIDWLMERQGITFREAVNHPGQASSIDGYSVSSANCVPPSRMRFQIPGWEMKAGQVVEDCVHILHAIDGEKPRQWLVNRGLKTETLIRWQIGYNPRPDRLGGMNVDQGILIPWIDFGMVKAINVRRPDSSPKYKMVTGSRRRGLYLGDAFEIRRPTLLVEGELDALLGWQEVGHLVNVATLGSATSRPDAEAIRLLLGSPVILLVYDHDDAGEKAADYWQKITKRVIHLQVPEGKDLTEFHQAGGDIKAWIHAHC